MNIKLKMLACAAVATAAAIAPAHAGRIPVDFKRSFTSVTCTGDSIVWWAAPDKKPEEGPMTVMITETWDKDGQGWTVGGDLRFDVKRYSRKTKDGYSMGSAMWDTDGFWAHWTMAFMDGGQVLFVKNSPNGVESATLSCNYAQGKIERSEQ